MYPQIFPEFERPAQKLEVNNQHFNIKLKKMNYKGKTVPKFTTQLGFVCNNVSCQLYEKQRTLYFSINTTTDYSPNWC